MNDVEQAITLAIGGDVSIAAQLKREHGERIHHLVPPSEIRMICSHMIKSGYLLCIACRDRKIEIRYGDDIGELRHCITRIGKIVEPFEVETAWDKTRAQRFACECAARVLSVFERRYPTAHQPRQTLDRANAALSDPTAKAALAQSWNDLCRLSLPSNAAHRALDAIISATNPHFTLGDAQDAATSALGCVASTISENYYGCSDITLDGTPPPNWSQFQDEVHLKVNAEERWQNHRLLEYLLENELHGILK